MKKEITIEEAKKVLAEYPSQDDYVQAHYRLFLGFDGEADDNTIETSDYWEKCKRLLDNPSKAK